MMYINITYVRFFNKYKHFKADTFFLNLNKKYNGFFYKIYIQGVYYSLLYKLIPFYVSK